ncbi:HAAS signaling domain-containing protein [Plantactinospora soyae]|uniref:DUF1700 domain-containing protein n=1 Tax=Plantactinospora soyae TaxID=1544732 RepID=A0A927M4N7_9ACTN|nr:hypothetical protein [Plantactinospora soyae]MBE1486731.1 hypothetical protein [Plantactinospora soyae]
MKPTTPDALVRRYLRRLRDELRDLPRDRRQEVLDQVNEHIAESRLAPDVRSTAQVQAMLDRLGDPATLGADARDRFGVPPSRRGPLETLVLLLSCLGPLLVVVPSIFVPFGLVRPWQVVPVIIVGLLWLSRVWRLRDKLVATALLLSAVGLFPVLRVVGFHDTNLPSLVAILLMLVVPFATAGTYLQIRIRRLTAPAPAGFATG